ncbi:MAG: hypothetical protein JSS75_12765 [Bacteroidetes bacterium]|nr:hypothetical protein [Bacteroidota bacterium]
MKLTLVLIFLASLVVGSSVAQTKHGTWSLRVTDIPLSHSWTEKTDYGETGNWTVTTGSDTVNESTSYWQLFSTVTVNDTVAMFDRLRGGSIITLGLDRLTHTIVSVSLFDRGNGPASEIAINLEGLHMQTTDSTYVLSLTGDALRGHITRLDSSYSDHSGSGYQIDVTDTMLGTFLPSSAVEFEISRVLFDSLDVSGATTSDATFPLRTSLDGNRLDVTFPAVETQCHLLFSDLLGRTIADEVVPGGASHTEISLATIPNGCYRCRIENRSTKVLVIR